MKNPPKTYFKYGWGSKIITVLVGQKCVYNIEYHKLSSTEN